MRVAAPNSTNVTTIAQFCQYGIFGKLGINPYIFAFCGYSRLAGLDDAFVVFLGGFWGERNADTMNQPANWFQTARCQQPAVPHGLRVRVDKFS